VEQVKSFAYLGNIVTVGGATFEGVRRRIRKANGAFVQFYPVWRIKNIVVRTKIRLFNTNVQSYFTCVKRGK
jgi:hypothetical protein